MPSFLPPGRGFNFAIDAMSIWILFAMIHVMILDKLVLAKHAAVGTRKVRVELTFAFMPLSFCFNETSLAAMSASNLRIMLTNIFVPFQLQGALTVHQTGQP